jgi:hypothetical protein
MQFLYAYLKLAESKFMKCGLIVLAKAVGFGHLSLFPYLGIPCGSPGDSLWFTWGFPVVHLGIPCSSPGDSLWFTWGFPVVHLGIPCGPSALWNAITINFMLFQT